MAEQKQRTDDEQELLRALVSGPAVGVPQHADEETRRTHQDRRMAQLEAYGQWIATSKIFWPGTSILVFSKGMQVPVEHVEMWELETAGVVQRVASPKLARVGRRFSAGDGGQLPGGDGDTVAGPDVSATPPAPPGETAAKDDEGGTTESKPRKTAAKAKTEGTN